MVNWRFLDLFLRLHFYLNFRLLNIIPLVWPDRTRFGLREGGPPLPQPLPVLAELSSWPWLPILLASVSSRSFSHRPFCAPARATLWVARDPNMDTHSIFVIALLQTTKTGRAKFVREF